MRPCLPWNEPRHHSLESCEWSVNTSPLLKLSSLSDRARKSNWAMASRISLSGKVDQDSADSHDDNDDDRDDDYDDGGGGKTTKIQKIRLMNLTMIK